MSISKLNCYIYALVAIISLGVFYFWPTYMEGQLKIIYRLMFLLASSLVICEILKRKRGTCFYCISLLWWSILIIYNIFYYRNYIAIKWSYVFFVFIIPFLSVYYTTLNQKGKKEIFYSFNKLLAIIMMPSLVIWLLLILGIDISYHVILPNHDGKVDVGLIYKCYLELSVILTSIGNVTSVDRLCGIFDEPGVVGTISGLLIAANGMSLTKKENIVILISGILSFSTAFYIILLLLLFFKILAQKKLIVIFLVPMLCLLYYIFINIPTTFPPLVRVQNAVTFDEGKLQGNNRESLATKAELDNIIKNHFLDLIGGYGHEAIKNNPKLFGSWSYRLFIYERGLIAVLIYGMQFFIAALYANRGMRFNYNQSIFMFIFVLSLYQRPEAACSIAYLIIFAGGIANLATINRNVQSNSHDNKTLLKHPNIYNFSDTLH